VIAEQGRENLVSIYATTLRNEIHTPESER
jgi:hypothetical protein